MRGCPCAGIEIGVEIAVEGFHIAITFGRRQIEDLHQRLVIVESVLAPIFELAQRPRPECDRHLLGVGDADGTLRGVARGQQSDESVAVWEPALAESGAVLLSERVRWMDQHEPEFARLTAAIGEPEPMTMRYVTSVADARNAADELRDTLARKRALDIRRGLTHTGPHRDDIALDIGGHDLRTFGSGGQQRTAAITLRLLEAETLKAHAGSDPLLLLDDPFAELDVRRSTHILALLHETVTGQTILTVPRAGDIPPDLSRLARWRIAGGAITAAA